MYLILYCLCTRLQQNTYLHDFLGSLCRFVRQNLKKIVTPPVAARASKRFMRPFIWNTRRRQVTHGQTNTRAARFVISSFCCVIAEFRAKPKLTIACKNILYIYFVLLTYIGRPIKPYCVSLSRENQTHPSPSGSVTLCLLFLGSIL